MTGIAPAAGTAEALLRLARPRGAPWVATGPLLGFAWAHWDRALVLREGSGILGVMAAWVLLHAGTMWLNAALDRDRGEVLFGVAVPVPSAAVPAAWTALLLAVVLAAAVHPVSGGCAAGCALLAVLYSHPRTAWKGHPWLGPAVNVVGYAGLSVLAGWALVGVGTNSRTLVTWALYGVWILGAYYAGQAFQEREDRERGYQTLVATHGAGAAVLSARLGLGSAMAMFAALCLAGWYPRAALLALPVFAWALTPLRVDRVVEPGWGSAFFRRLLLFAWVLLACVTGEYLRESFVGEPVAGLGTAAGHPADRPRLPPAALRRWERLARPEPARIATPAREAPPPADPG